MQNGITDDRDTGKKEPSLMMLIPLGILASLTIILGVLPNPLIHYISQLVSGLM